MGKVCEMCVLAGFTFPRTCRRPSFEFPPPPLRDCTLVRNEAHFDPPQKKVFLPAGIFPPCFRCLLSRANHEVTRRANTPAFPFVRHRETCYSQCCREIRWKPGQRKRVQPFRARNRDTLSLFLLFQHFAPHRLENSYNNILFREYSENQGAYFLLQICRDTCRCCARWQDGSHVSWRNETQIYIYIYFVCRNWISHGCVTLIHCIDSC